MGGAEAASTFERRMHAYTVVQAAESLGDNSVSASNDARAANRWSAAATGSHVPAAPPAEAWERTSAVYTVPANAAMMLPSADRADWNGAMRKGYDACLARKDAPPTAAPHAPGARSALAAPAVAAPTEAEMSYMRDCRMARARRGTRTRQGVRAGSQAPLRRTESEA